MRWMEHVASMTELKMHTDFSEQTWGQIPIARPRYRRQDNIKMGLGE